MPMNLLILLVERVGVLIALAFLFTRSAAFRRMVEGRMQPAERLWLGLAFGVCGVLGTYTGVVIGPEGAAPATLVGTPLLPEEAIANSRAVSVILAGFLGGPVTGLIAGALAGGHRLLLGGFTGLACGLATASQGLVAGLLRRMPGRMHSTLSPGSALLAAAVLEIMQMVIILLVAKPYPAALALVRMIALPMIVANSLGVAFFVVAARVILDAEAAREADAARKTLAIATQTLPILEQGLSPDSALEAARLIRSVTGMAAVALTDTERILAHVGIGDDHHRPGARLFTAVTRRAIAEDRTQVAPDAAAIECDHPHCPLQAAVVVPLHEGGQVVGALKLYFNPERSRAPLELAEGLGYHFSTQLTLARAQRQAALLDKAEIRALQAQIQPHFLFNALNTVMALIRLDAGKAREVLGHLADFLRRNLQSTQEETVPLAREIEHVRNYLAVEEARFGDRLTVTYALDPAVQAVPLPPLTLQPIVENALVHGLKGVKRPWQIAIRAQVSGGQAEISVSDNGRGIDPDRLATLLDRPAASRGIQSGLALRTPYILMAPEGFRLPVSVAYPLGLAITAAIVILFALKVRPNFGILLPQGSDD